MKRRILLGSCVVLCALLFGAGCSTGDVVVRPKFSAYKKVGLVGNLDRDNEQWFISHYMNAFPNQVIVERRDVEAIIGEQDILPSRLNEASRAKIRKILGLDALIVPEKHGTPSPAGFHTKDVYFTLRVVDTETGEIIAAISKRNRNIYGTWYNVIEASVGDLKKQSRK